MNNQSSTAAKISTSPAGPGRRPFGRASQPRRRLALSLLLSLLVHALLLSLSFGGQEFGLPGFAFPWQDRRAAVPDLLAGLAPAASPETKLVIASVAVPLPPVLIKQTPVGGPLLVTFKSSAPRTELPAPPVVSRSPSAAKASPRPKAATRKSRAKAAAAAPANAGPAPTPFPAVIALEQPTDPEFVVPPASLAEAPEVSTTPGDEGAAAPAPSDEAVPEMAAEEAAPAEAAPHEAERQPAAGAEAERLEAERQDNARQEATRLELAQQEAERQEAEWVEVERLADENRENERLAAARQEAERQETERLAAVRAEAELQESERREVARQAAAQQAAERVEAERLATERRENERLAAARQELAEQEAERQATARAEAERLAAENREVARQAAARQEAARAEAERLAAERQENARQMAAQQAQAQQEAARLEAAREQDARRDAARRAMGRQLDEEADRRKAEQAARERSPSASLFRRARLFGRTDPNVELVLYAEAWSRKIQFNTAFDMVREVAKQPHTDALVTVAIRSDGSIEAVTIVRSSGVAAIDDAIRRVVHSQTPNLPFQPGLARDFDVIEIRRTWHFDTAIRLY